MSQETLGQVVLDRPLGARQERYLVHALTNALGNERNYLEHMTAWATQRQLGALVARGLFERSHPNHGTYGPNWKGRQRAERWTLTEKGRAVARVIRAKWQLSGWGAKGPPSKTLGPAFDAFVIDDPLPTGG